MGNSSTSTSDKDYENNVVWKTDTYTITSITRYTRIEKLKTYSRFTVSANDQRPLKEFLMDTGVAIKFFREVLHHIESFQNLVHFQLQILLENETWKMIIVFWEAIDRVDRKSNCMSCPDPKTKELTEKQKAHLLCTNQHHNCWIDAKRRPVFIVTPIQHHEKLSQLEDEAIPSLFLDGIHIVEEHFGHYQFQIMKLNHGNCRNKPHLHLKIFVDRDLFYSHPRYTQFLEDSNKVK